MIGKEKRMNTDDYTALIDDYNTWGKQLEELLRLQTHPVAVKWYEKAADLPDDILVPTKVLNKHMALCQAFSYARMAGACVALTKRDHWCWDPLIGYGHVECYPGHPQFDQVSRYMGISGKRTAEDFIEKYPKLPFGKYEAVAVAPLSGCSFAPDVVTLYTTPAKLNYLMGCITRVVGGSITSVFDSVGSCVYCTVPSFLTGEFRITLPDPGERERARAREDEIILTIPAAHLEELVQAVDRMSRFMPCDDFRVDLTLDFPRPAFYNELYQLWGLDTDADWTPEK